MLGSGSLPSSLGLDSILGFGKNPPIARVNMLIQKLNELVPQPEMIAIVSPTSPIVSSAAQCSTKLKQPRVTIPPRMRLARTTCT
jgi:hypothetical protein